MPRSPGRECISWEEHTQPLQSFLDTTGFACYNCANVCADRNFSALKRGSQAVLDVAGEVSAKVGFSQGRCPSGGCVRFHGVSCAVLSSARKIEARPWIKAHPFGTLLFDLAADPRQERPLHDPEVEARMIQLLIRLMVENDAPPEQFERLGLQEEYRRSAEAGEE